MRPLDRREARADNRCTAARKGRTTAVGGAASALEPCRAAPAQHFNSNVVGVSLTRKRKSGGGNCRTGSPPPCVLRLQGHARLPQGPSCFTVQVLKCQSRIRCMQRFNKRRTWSCVAQMLASNPARAAIRGEGFNLPLVAAAAYGHLATVRLLLQLYPAGAAYRTRATPLSTARGFPPAAVRSREAASRCRYFGSCAD